jgi:hypothetical protein
VFCYWVYSLLLRIDGEVANLGKYSVTRRVARTLYLGSAPIDKVAIKGVEDRRIKLGSTLPGETAAVLALHSGDSLCADLSVQEGPRYWLRNACLHGRQSELSGYAK